MAKLEIDPTTLNLGSAGSKLFTVAYLPVNTAQEAEICELPPNLLESFVLPEVPEISQSCKFVFPQNTIIPPIYNPPVVFPPMCEEFTAKVNLTTDKALSRSTLTATTTSTPNCGIVLDGHLRLEACETFTATATAVTSPGTRRTTVRVVPRSVPDCGLDLVTNFNIDACLDFSAAGNIRFLGAARNSFIHIRPQGEPNCGLTYDGAINVKACEYVTFTSDLKISSPSCTYKMGKDTTRDVFKKTSEETILTIRPNAFPDCGFQLSGVIEIPHVECALVDVWPEFAERDQVVFGDCWHTFCLTIMLRDPVIMESEADIIDKTCWIFKHVDGMNGSCIGGDAGGGGAGGCGIPKSMKKIQCGYYELLVMPPMGWECDWSATNKWWSANCRCKSDGSFRAMCGTPCAVSIVLKRSWILELKAGDYSVSINPGDFTESALRTCEARFRKVKFCDDGEDQQAWVLMTEPEPWRGED